MIFGLQKRYQLKSVAEPAMQVPLTESKLLKMLQWEDIVAKARQSSSYNSFINYNAHSSMYVVGCFTTIILH